MRVSVKIAVGALLLLMTLVSVPMAYATPARIITGKFTVTSYTVTSTQFVGGNTIISWNATAVSAGSLSRSFVITAVELDSPDGSHWCLPA